MVGLIKASYSREWQVGNELVQFGFAFFVAGDVGCGPGDELLEAGFAVAGHEVKF
jgi:hypothetical protein